MTADFDRIEVVDLSRSFGRRRALNRITLKCHAGEIVGLLGPNGAGKSTLLFVLATLLSPSSGTIRYGRFDWTSGAPVRRRIGLLAHDPHLYPELSPLENLIFFARLFNVPQPGRIARMALESAGLLERAHDPVASFSRGMRQRVALERALLHGPRLVLLDEPFTGLDETARSSLERRLLELKRRGTIVMLATHDQATVQRVADRTVALLDGRLTRQSIGAADLSNL